MVGVWDTALPSDNPAAAFAGRNVKPRVAILREQGVNSQYEMAYGFHAAVLHFRGENVEALQSAERAVQLCEENGFAVEATEDPAAFTDRNLRRFTAVLFLNTTAEVMRPAGRKALRRFVLSGGGWVGVHSAADTEYDWPFYSRLLAGGRFLAHPLEQPGRARRAAACGRWRPRCA